MRGHRIQAQAKQQFWILALLEPQISLIGHQKSSWPNKCWPKNSHTHTQKERERGKEFQKFFIESLTYSRKRCLRLKDITWQHRVADTDRAAQGFLPGGSAFVDSANHHRNVPKFGLFCFVFKLQFMLTSSTREADIKEDCQEFNKQPELRCLRDRLHRTASQKSHHKFELYSETHLKNPKTKEAYIWAYANVFQDQHPLSDTIYRCAG